MGEGSIARAHSAATNLQWATTSGHNIVKLSKLRHSFRYSRKLTESQRAEQLTQTVTQQTPTMYSGVNVKLAREHYAVLYPRAVVASAGAAAAMAPCAAAA